MECRDAQFYLRLRRHAADELGSDVTASLNDHLAGCEACAAEARNTASFDRLMAAAMQAVPVPSGLRDRLVTQGAKQQGAAFRQKAYRGGALVGAALVVIALGLSLISSTRPKVETDTLVQVADEQLNNPEASTRKWLAEQKLPDRLPVPDLDYDLLIFRGYEDVKGKKVPVVVFRSSEGSGFAKVYIFRHDGEFDRKDIRDAQASHAGAKVVIGQDHFRNATYVFVHTGRDLAPFLRTRKAGQLGV